MKSIFSARKINYSIWAAFIAAFMSFIWAISYLYPLTGDDYNISSSWADVIKNFIFSYKEYSPKIGSLFAISVIYIGRSFFLFINPLIQIISAFLLFVLLFLRLPSFKTLDDFAPFALICLVGVFGTAAPDNTIFWMAGACNYSWTFIFFLVFLCLLRFFMEGKDLVPQNKLFWIALFILGIITGMINENNSPMALIICAALWAFKKYKREDLPPWFYVLSAGIVCGVILLFTASGSYNRAEMDIAAFAFRMAPLPQKIFLNISYVQDFIAGNFYFPMITATAIIVALFDYKRQLKDKDLIYSAVLLIIALGLAFALTLAPHPPQRAFYSASVLSTASFILCLKYWGKLYKTDLIKLTFAAILIYCVIILPLFILPYFSLHSQALKREAALNKARAENKAEIALPKYFILRGPSGNLTITFYDVLLGKALSIEKFLNISYLETPQEAAENVGNTSRVF